MLTVEIFSLVKEKNLPTVRCAPELSPATKPDFKLKWQVWLPDTGQEAEFLAFQELQILEWHRKNNPLPWPDANTISDMPQDTACPPAWQGTPKPTFHLLSITIHRSLSAGVLPSLYVHPGLPHSRCRILHLPFVWLVIGQPSELSMPLCLRGTQQLLTI